MISLRIGKLLYSRVFSIILEYPFLRGLETSLRQGGRACFYLPHSSGLDDKVEIGGAFFSAAKRPIRGIAKILARLMATARPFCQAGIFELDIKSLNDVSWRVKDWSEEYEIQGGPEPFKQALAKMPCLGHEEKQPQSMLSLVGILEEKLPDWEVSLLRSCCLSLRKKREDRLFYAIDLSLAPKDAVLASTSIRTSIRSGGKIIAEGKSVATHREHILPFILEVAKRINELAVPLSEPVAAWWGQVPVVIAPPDLSPDKFLRERYRLLEI
jgi:hypothetical protein